MINDDQSEERTGRTNQSLKTADPGLCKSLRLSAVTVNNKQTLILNHEEQKHPIPLKKFY